MLKMPFVAAGISDVMTALATDTQFVTRFEKLELPKWGFNQSTLRMLKSLGKRFALGRAIQVV